MAKLYQRGASWYVDTGQRGTGGRVSLGRVTQAEAQAALTAIERAGSGDGPRFEAWAVEYGQWHAAEYPDSYFRIEQILRQHLIPAFGGLALTAIARQDAERYKQQRTEAGASPATVAKELRTLQAVLNKAVEWEIIDRNRLRGVRPPKDMNSRPPRWYTRAELDAIYDADPIHHGQWRLLANTGMRRSEGLQLQWRDVSSEAIKVLSEPGARTKSSRWRLVPVTPGARVALSMLPKAGPHVLPQVEPPSLSRAFAKAASRAGLDGSLHCLRHTYCSHLVMAGVPLRTVQVLAGHSTINVTERYAHLAPDYLREAVAGLNL